jgi:hypothetical protein
MPTDLYPTLRQMLNRLWPSVDPSLPVFLHGDVMRRHRGFFTAISSTALRTLMGWSV